MQIPTTSDYHFFHRYWLPLGSLATSSTARLMDIIAGKSATKFAPNATVTGIEAAKMLLVTLGYNAQKAGLVGTGWAIQDQRTG